MAGACAATGYVLNAVTPGVLHARADRVRGCHGVVPAVIEGAEPIKLRVPFKTAVTKLSWTAVRAFGPQVRRAGGVLPFGVNISG